MDEERIRKRLIELQEALACESAASIETRAAVELDQQSVGRLSRQDALQRQAMAEAEERRRALQRKRIKAALKRLDDDEYGLCAVCGEEIAAGRLDRDPSVAVCVDCAG